MKSLRYLVSFTVLMMMLSLGAMAKDKDSGTFDLSAPARVGSTELAPGHYKIEWSGTANDVKVSVLQVGKQVATADGKIKNLPERSRYTSVTLKTLGDNTQAVEEIQFNNRTEALELTSGE